MGEGGVVVVVQKDFPTSFSPVISTDLRISPQNILILF